MTQLVVASTISGAITAAAAADAGLLPDHGERVLLVVNDAPVPELVLPLDEIPGAAPVLERFDRVVHLNDVIAPVLPAQWRPEARERPALEVLLRNYWQLGDGELSLVCQSIWDSPAQALARVFHAATITVYADGLMSYGPTHRALPLDVAQRLERFVHLDLVPGLRPAQLREHEVDSAVIPASSFRGLIAEVAGDADRVPGGGVGPALDAQGGVALVAGQYLAALELLTREEEAELHAAMVRAAAEDGARSVHVKPHPWAPPGLLKPLWQAAREVGVELEILTSPLPAEALLHTGRYAVLIGCFSTALATARSLYGLRTLTVGSAELLGNLQPYGNRNRVPLVLTDVMHRTGETLASPAERQALLDAVAFTMRPEQLAHWHADVTGHVAGMPSAERDRYFPAARLRKLELPGPAESGPSPQ